MHMQVFAKKFYYEKIDCFMKHYFQTIIFQTIYLTETYII